MKLSEIKKLAGPSTHEFVFSKWDGNEPSGSIITPFDILIKYEKEDLGSSDHPYGEGTARENHGVSVVVLSVTADEDVTMMDEDEQEIVKVYPKGTAVDKIPGFSKSSNKFFLEKAELDAQT